MRIITDSSSDLTPELIERFKVDLVIPMKISIDGKEYLDKVDIQDEPFYHEILPACQSLPKTSQVTANEFCEIFSRYPDEELVVLPISSGLSGTYSAALVAREMLGRKDIYVVDNKATALALALMVQIACEKRDAGLSAREVAEQVEALSGRVRVYALVETLRYLVLGGRLSKAAGLVGSALNLKPIIMLKGGVLSAVGKARGTRAAVKLLRELVDTPSTTRASPCSSRPSRSTRPRRRCSPSAASWARTRAPRSRPSPSSPRSRHSAILPIYILAASGLRPNGRRPKHAAKSAPPPRSCAIPLIFHRNRRNP